MNGSVGPSAAGKWCIAYIFNMEKRNDRPNYTYSFVLRILMALLFIFTMATVSGPQSVKSWIIRMVKEPRKKKKKADWRYYQLFDSVSSPGNEAIYS
jgi:hypothetical protein